MQVDFVTLGGASDRLSVPSPTLRGWTDQLEEYETHYVKRNNRNERIYYRSDLDIFEFLRDLKKEHGRKTTTKDLASMIAIDGRFELRSREEAPSPTESPSNKTNELLNQEDIQRLMDSDRVKQFIGVIMEETAKNLRDDITKDVREAVKEELREERDEQIKKMEEISEKMDQRLKERDDQTSKHIQEIANSKKKGGFLSKLFGQ